MVVVVLFVLERGDTVTHYIGWESLCSLSWILCVQKSRPLEGVSTMHYGTVKVNFKSVICLPQKTSVISNSIWKFLWQKEKQKLKNSSLHCLCEQSLTVTTCLLFTKLIYIPVILVSQCVCQIIAVSWRALLVVAAQSPFGRFLNLLTTRSTWYVPRKCK